MVYYPVSEGGSADHPLFRVVDKEGVIWARLVSFAPEFPLKLQQVFLKFQKKGSYGRIVPFAFLCFLRSKEQVVEGIYFIKKPIKRFHQMSSSKETIIQKVYDLLKHSIPVLNKFPRSQKFTLADRIQNSLSELLEEIIRAYYSPVSTKKEMLQQVNIRLEILRHYFRLCYDLGLYSSLKYKGFAERLDEIGRMTGGWLRSLK